MKSEPRPIRSQISNANVATSTRTSGSINDNVLRWLIRDAIVGGQLLKERVADGPVAIGIEMNAIVRKLWTDPFVHQHERRFKQIDKGHISTGRHFSHGLRVGIEFVIPLAMVGC